MHHRYMALLRESKFCLPRGMNWSDSFQTKAANTDLKFGRDNLPGRVTYQEGVGFSIDSLSPWRWNDIKIYRNRIARYELGKLQELFLDELPITDWPQNMDLVNQQIDANFADLTKTLSMPKRCLVRRRLNRQLAAVVTRGDS